MCGFHAAAMPAYSRPHAARPVLLRRDRPRGARAPGARGRCELRRVRGRARVIAGLRGGARAGRARLPRRAARGRAGRLGRLGAQRRPGDLRLRHEPVQPRRAGRHRIGAPDVERLRRSPRLGARPRRAPRHRLRPATGVTCTWPPGHASAASCWTCNGNWRTCTATARRGSWNAATSRRCSRRRATAPACTTPRSGHLHPLNYTLGLARAAVAAGVVIHEGSPVTRIVPGDPLRLVTPRGTVTARHAVLTRGGYLAACVRPPTGG
jgi:glycine/D-amino acid oxidase-like deaminating enzyme